MFYEVVVPLIMVKNTGLICISTVREEHNFYSRILQKRNHDGTPIWNVKRVRMNKACKACTAAEGQTKDCPHLGDPLPAWIDHDNVQVAKILMEDHNALMEQELFGNECSSVTPIFNSAWVDMVENAPRSSIPSMRDAREIFVTIDPNGGKTSRFAIVSATYVNGSQYVSFIFILFIFFGRGEGYKQV